ncbi:hypothetical protein K435DRAFT_971968 [Dendrothele bispora CBS 962.96]|uniref:HMA domain-containing protein n=1 Tax=Dendrothele bispora (strain CBS 962.96) TaxID=1314807 RepID=A0A4S8L2B6_DENBC|nr:hypothetical protein K435DRAFT_971968 [Dendrothele bispora CBS 962.96]
MLPIILAVSYLFIVMSNRSRYSPARLPEVSRQNSRSFTRNVRDNSSHPRQNSRRVSPDIHVNIAGRPQGGEPPIDLDPSYALFFSLLRNIPGIENAHISVNRVAGNLTYNYNETISAINKSHNHSSTNEYHSYHCDWCAWHRAPPGYNPNYGSWYRGQ